VIDPDVDRIRWDDDGLTFTAKRRALHEGNLVSVPADPLSGTRSFGTGHDRATFIGISNRADDVLTRMQVRQCMYERQAAIGRDDE
jgi:hypothetical protein